MPGIDLTLRDAMSVPGTLSASLVDYTTGLPIGSSGEWPDGGPDSAAAGATDVVRAALENVAFADSVAGDTIGDILLGSARHYHLLRFVRTQFDSRTFLYLRLDRAEANLAIARRRLDTLAENLVLA